MLVEKIMIAMCSMPNFAIRHWKFTKPVHAKNLELQFGPSELRLYPKMVLTLRSLDDYLTR